MQRDKTNISAQIDSLDKIIRDLKNANNELKMKCEEYSKMQVEYYQSKLPVEYYKLKDLNYKLISENEIKDTEKDDLKKRTKCLEEKVTTQTKKINDLKKENDELKIHVNSLELKVSSLKEELKNEREDRKKFEERIPEIAKGKIEEMLKKWKYE